MPPVRFHDEKAEALRKQVIAKIYWNSSAQEVLDWLHDEKGITGADAERLLSEANAARRKSVRVSAFLRMLFSTVGIAVTAFYFYPQFTGLVIVYGKGPALMAGLGLTSSAYFFRSLWRFVTGKTSGPID